MSLKHFARIPCVLWLKWLLFDYVASQIRHRGKHLKVGYFAYVRDCDFGIYNAVGDFSHLSAVRMNDFSYVSERSTIGRTKIGKFCSLGPNLLCGPGRHPADKFLSTHPVFYSSRGQVLTSFSDRDYFEEYKEIEIGNDVWIGANVIILDGVKIGDGAIVAAGAVVYKDVPPYAVVGGVPAQVVKYRFGQDIIESLLKKRWWDMDYEYLRRHFRDFHDSSNMNSI